MEWQIVVALAVAIPVIVFPVVLVWYLNAGGIIAAVKEARKRRAVEKKSRHPKETVTYEHEYEVALTKALKHYPWREE